MGTPHENARPHVHGLTKDFLIEQDLTIMEHPPHSPDHAPCDFWLNSYIKDRLAEQPNVEALIASITAILDSIPKSEYLKTFQTWAERMKLYIKYKQLTWTYNIKIKTQNCYFSFLCSNEINFLTRNSHKTTVKNFLIFSIYSYTKTIQTSNQSFF